jgi:multiple sugar transport system ATP-binding protein
MSVYKNIAFPLESQGVTKSEVERQVREVAEILQIGHILKKKPGSLSGGDMQRVALGRAMVRRPKAFLMDEPIGTLDAKFREEMRTELKRLHIDIDATTVYVTHDQVEAMSMGDRIAVMKNAELQQVGRPSEVYDNPVNLFVANFIGSPGMNFMDVTCSRSDHTMTASMRNDRSICFAFSEKVYRKLEDKGAFGKNLVLGIRPEWVVIDQAQSDGAAPAEVYVVELLGPNKIVDLKVGNDIIKARTGAEFSADIGDRVWVRFNEKKVHFFDKDSGDAIDIT